MDKDFFVKEIKVHGGMLCQVTCTMQVSDTSFAAADEIIPGYQKSILSK